MKTASFAVTGSHMPFVQKSGFTLLYGEGVPADPPQEVRCAVRFPLILPMVVLCNNKEQPAITRNVSASGVLFEAEQALAVGELIRFSFRMPGSVLGTPRDVLVDCSGRVVRCLLSQSQPQIAATIDDYRFVEQ